MNENLQQKEVLVLDNLKTSNLTELQGWEDKQNQLVLENPYVEIVDNKTYELACKRRTALLKGRTELEKQDKLIAGKLTTFIKDVKSETEKLIEITKPYEEKQQEEVKRFEAIKEIEKQKAIELEEQRISTIKTKIDSFETDSYNVINKTTIEDVEYSKTILDAMVNVEFDYEEFDILFEKAKQRVQQTWDLKCNEIQEKEAQRKRTEQLEQEAAEAKRLSDLQASRLKELLPYNSFGSEVDMTTLSDLSGFEYNDILAEKKSLFEAKQVADKEAQDKLESETLERENKAKADKEKIFEIRKTRFENAGIDLGDGFDLLLINKSDGTKFELSKEMIFESDTIGFEELYNATICEFEKRKLDLIIAEQAKIETENLEKEKQAQLLKDNEARKERLFGDKTGISVSLGKIKDVFISEIAYTQYDNEETENFRKSLEVKFDSLFTECLTDLNNL